jgi:hypothetical protein
VRERERESESERERERERKKEKERKKVNLCGRPQGLVQYNEGQDGKAYFSTFQQKLFFFALLTS